MAETLKTTFMDAGDMTRTLTRMSQEIVEKSKDVTSLAFMGVGKRATALARHLHEMIMAYEGIDVPVGELEMKESRASMVNGPFAVDGKTVVLVEAVLYTGQTVRAAIETIMKMGKPRRIQLAALVDRGHRELPIHADYLGRAIPTSLRESVRVRVWDVDEVEDASIWEQKTE